MRNVAILITALDVVEERLCEPFNTNDLANACYLSYSGLQKLFNYAFKCSVKEYITKRRLTCASRELLISDTSITNIAFDYQYGSSEAFSRAFKRFWGISPNEFRKTRRFTELFPKFALEINSKGDVHMSRRKPVDISILYDELKKYKDSYILSIDLIHFDNVNKSFGYTAGDLVIAKAFERLENNLLDNMLLFRIGGDEFAVITGYSSLNDAEILAKKIISFNGETIKYKTQEIPVSLRIGISRLDGLNYRDTLNNMYNAMDKARNSNDNIAVYSEHNCK